MVAEVHCRMQRSYWVLVRANILENCCKYASLLLPILVSQFTCLSYSLSGIAELMIFLKLLIDKKPADFATIFANIAMWHCEAGVLASNFFAFMVYRKRFREYRWNVNTSMQIWIITRGCSPRLVFWLAGTVLETLYCRILLQNAENYKQWLRWAASPHFFERRYFVAIKNENDPAHL